MTRPMNREDYERQGRWIALVLIIVGLWLFTVLVQGCQEAPSGCTSDQYGQCV